VRLTIDLDELDAFDDYAVGTLIRDEVKGSIQGAIRKIVKEVLKQQEKELRAAVEKAAKKDWKRVGTILEQLQGE